MLRTVAVRRLGEGQAAALLDRLDAQGPVPVASRKHDARRVFALIAGEGAEEDIDRLALAPGRGWLAHPQPSVLDVEDRIRRQDVDFVGRHLHIVLGHVHRHLGVARDDLGQEASPVWAEVRDHDEGAARVRGRAAEQPFQGLDASRGGPDADHREGRLTARHRTRS